MDFLEEFGKLVMREVFDKSIKRNKNIIKGNVNAHKLVEMHESISNISESHLNEVEKLCVEAIKNVLHNFLWMIEQSDDFDLVSKTDESTVSLKEISDGLCGELYTEDGWIEKYSDYKLLIDVC